MKNKPNILAIAHKPTVINTLAEILHNHSVLCITKDCYELQKKCAEFTPDIILLDDEQISQTQQQLCKGLRKNMSYANVAILCLVLDCCPQLEESLFACGATDYINKPITTVTLLKRIEIQWQLCAARQRITVNERDYEARIKNRILEIETVQDSAIHSLATLAEVRDRDTGAHVWRTQHYVKALAEALQKNSPYNKYLNTNIINLLFKSAPLHDVGKIAIEDRVLKKQGKLSSNEFREMQEHVVIGAKALEEVMKRAGQSEFLKLAWEITYFHHERWDGKGYPENLKGEEIPISARIMALCDVYDALVSRRVYKLETSHAEAMQYISSQRGLHFDPEMTDVFLNIEDQIHHIANCFTDN